MGKESNEVEETQPEATQKPNKSGALKRYKRKIEDLEKQLEESKKTKPETKKSGEDKTSKKGFDYAEKAFLKVNDVNTDEYELVQQIMDDTGKSLDEVLESKYFRSEQNELREAKASKEAIPQGSKRAGKSGQSSVDYWLAKGELPPADQPDLRREYVNARIKRDADKSRFTDNPVVK